MDDWFQFSSDFLKHKRIKNIEIKFILLMNIFEIIYVKQIQPDSKLMMFDQCLMYSK